MKIKYVLKMILEMIASYLRLWARKAKKYTELKELSIFYNFYWYQPPKFKLRQE